MVHRGIRTTRTGGTRSSARAWLGRAGTMALVAALTACGWAGQSQQPVAAPSVSQSAAADPTPSPDPSSTAPSATPEPSTTSAAPSDAASTDPSATPSPEASGGPSSDPAQAAPPAPAQSSSPAAPQYVQLGSSGPDVLAVQKRLQALGYGLLNPDGHYGSATQQAVWALQKAAGLRRDGVIGPQTQVALDAGYRPSPRTTSGHVVEIDLERQILMAVDDGHVTRTINASSGSGQKFEAQGQPFTANTPRGTFHVYKQDNGLHASSLELGNMWRPKYFTGGIAVHGSGSIPTHPASHGCVRVSNGAMNWLWDSWEMPIGTLVLVY